jgi:SNF2 family DNA or RNA helicase
MDSKIAFHYKQAVSSLHGRLIAPYQREGVAWMLYRELVPTGPKGGFLSDEMGLGKTVQLIATMLGNTKRHTLIVVPKSIVSQWKDEIEKFAPTMRVLLFEGGGRTKNAADCTNYDVVIAPYSVTFVPGKPLGTPTILHQIQWDRVILDEGHEVRTLRSKRHASLANLKASIRWVVSGTPVVNSMKDFVALCSFIGLSRSLVQARTQEIRTTYVLRRTKDDVSTFNVRLSLPPCDFENVDITMYPEERELYRSVFEQNKERVTSLVRMSTNIGMHYMEILECLLRVRQVMVHPQLYLNGIAAKNNEEPVQWKHGSMKMERLMEMLATHPNEKTLIFCQFIEEMNMMEQRIGHVCRIDGSVDKDTRDRDIRRFNESSGGAVFLIQIKAGGQGLNLQAATRVYIMAPSWNPATELQAIARSHRTGQTKKVVVRKFICTGEEAYPSVEESIVSLQGHKSQICSEVLNDPRLIGQIPQSRTRVALAEVLKIFQV